MHLTEINEKRNRGILICREPEAIFSAHISVHFQDMVKSVHTDAVAMVYEDALLSGCGAYSRQEFTDAVSLLGAQIDITISQGVFTCSLQSLNTQREQLLSLVSTMFLKPTFASAEIKRITALQTSQLQEEKEDAKVQSVQKFFDALYIKKDHRYQYTENALIAVLPTITQKDLRDFHTAILGRAWTYTILSNNAAAQKTVEKITDIQKNFRYIANIPVIPLHKNVTRTEVKTTAIPSRQNIELAIGSTIPLTFADTDYFAFLFGLQVLGKWGGFAGRLMSIIREKEGLTYGIYARTENISAANMGNWRIMTFFAPEKVMQGITSTLREIKKIAQKGITDSEFIRFKTILKTKEILLQDSAAATAQNIHSLQLAGLTLSQIKVYKKNLLLISKKQVNQALKKYLDVTKLVISAAGPTKSKEKELKALTAIAKEKK